MALSHNVFIRGLNSIYLQAPHVQPSDVPDFIEYSKCWVEVLNNHHEMEETGVFRKDDLSLRTLLFWPKIIRRLPEFFAHYASFLFG